MNSLWHRFAGLALAAAALTPALSRVLEQRMVTHMLLQIPALLFAGGLLATTLPSASERSWNRGGVPGLLAASLVLAFWMTPIALDLAVASPAWDIAKAVSLLLAGAVSFASWHIAPTVVRAFFLGNFVWMTATVGIFYQDESRRLCNAYLLYDQHLTGEALVVLAVASCLLWIAAAAPFTFPSTRTRRAAQE